jgi:hypothetical protein
MHYFVSCIAAWDVETNDVIHAYLWTLPFTTRQCDIYLSENYTPLYIMLCHCIDQRLCVCVAMDAKIYNCIYAKASSLRCYLGKIHVLHSCAHFEVLREERRVKKWWWRVLSAPSCKLKRWWIARERAKKPLVLSTLTHTYVQRRPGGLSSSENAPGERVLCKVCVCALSTHKFSCSCSQCV